MLCSYHKKRIIYKYVYNIIRKEGRERKKEGGWKLLEIMD